MVQSSATLARHPHTTILSQDNARATAMIPLANTSELVRTSGGGGSTTGRKILVDAAYCSPIFRHWLLALFQYIPQSHVPVAPF